MTDEALDTALQTAGPIENLSFNGEDLSEYHIVEAQFRNCHFKNCNFDLSKIHSSEFINCRFVHCSLREAEFQNCSFYDEVKQTGSQWSFCNLTEARFSRSNLSLNKLDKCDAYRLEFIECAASGISLEISVHREVGKRILTGGVRFSDCKMQYAVFVPGNYEESRFEQCDLRDASFAGSNLTRTSFIGSSINNIDLSGATLDNAVLANATFDEIDLVSMFSYHAMVVSRDQHENILASIGIITLN